jgi:KaiC/GvpD/RAD55 family RecA-like ATPase
VTSVPIEQLLTALPSAKRNGSGWHAKCPAHDDKRPSLSISQGDDGRVLVNCHAGCTATAIISALGMTMRDLMPDGNNGNGGTASYAAARPARTFPTAQAAIAELEKRHGGHVARWTYHDIDGKPIGVVVRWEKSGGKDIRPVSHNGSGWIIGGLPAPRPLYHLPDLADADRVFITEGEKAADAAWLIGLTATTSPHGSKSAGKADWGPLAGKQVFVLPDNDPAGQRYADDVVRCLGKLTPAPTVKIVTLPNLPAGGDVVDYTDSRDCVESADIRAEIEALADAAPQCEPPTPDGQPEQGPTIADPLDSAGLETLLQDTIAGTRRNIAWPFDRLTMDARALLPGTLTVLCGGAGSTKSMLISQSCLFWLKACVPCAVFHLEEDREFHLNRALAQIEGNSSLTLDDYVRENPDITLDAYDRRQDLLNDLSACMWDAPNTDLCTLDVIDWVNERAKEGRRIIIVDPITAADNGSEPWHVDRRFVLHTKRIMREHGASLIVVTHPRDGNPKHGGSHLDNIAGGRAYNRFTQSVLMLESLPKPESHSVSASWGSKSVLVNRIITVRKARSGPGAGVKIGYFFDAETLRMAEQGTLLETK